MKTIGFIGLGLMGEAMSKNIVKKFDGTVLVFDINADAVARVVEAGAVAAASVADVAREADVIISMVPRSEHVKAVYSEMLPHLCSGKITIDMSTIDPAVSIEVAKQVVATGEFFGIDKESFNTAVSYGGGSNFYLTSKIGALVAENYATAFSLENMAKDVGIMKTLMQEDGLTLPGVDVVSRIYQQGLADGLGREDFCATYKVVKHNLK